MVLKTLLYGCKTWTAYARHSRQLNHLHLRCLGKILHIKWQHKVPDTEVLKRSGMPSIHTILQKNQIRRTGDVLRMADSRIAKQLMYGKLTDGARSKVGQRKQYKDPLKCSLKTFGIDAQTWKKSALDSPSWRASIHKGAKAAEARRSAEAELKRRLRKDRAVDGTIITLCTCLICGRSFRANIGLSSHMRMHNR